MAETSYDRILPLTGVCNVRDLGAYPAAGGRRVKQGLIYRSGDIDSLTDKDRIVMEGLGLKTIVDFRSEEERTRAPDPDFASLVNRIWLPINAGNITGIDRRKDSRSYREVMMDLYHSLVQDLIPEYRRFFAVVADTLSAPLLFHCSAGKDRTGVAAALFLSALGVDRETVYSDYELSDVLLKERFRPLVEAHPDVADVVATRREYLAVSFKIVDEEYGGVDRYLAEQLKADSATLRAFYTV
ncbi:MAG: tyrosine-protein phosphatase [Spirochaetaceae bacterium]|jgi:protein-tyrosine phosphatase|nr:tyrosine-protein phosphatase [Spirochaetaceae bacterium]